MRTGYFYVPAGSMLCREVFRSGHGTISQPGENGSGDIGTLPAGKRRRVRWRGKTPGPPRAEPRIFPMSPIASDPPVRSASRRLSRYLPAEISSGLRRGRKPGGYPPIVISSGLRRGRKPGGYPPAARNSIREEGTQKRFHFRLRRRNCRIFQIFRLYFMISRNILISVNINLLMVNKWPIRN